MARSKRGKNVDPSRVQVLHVYNRCTRQGHLLGRDPATGKDRSYRRDWVRQRLQHLAGIFSIEILTYAVMSTHVHQVIRNRPDLAQAWDPETIARRWLAITPKYNRKTGEPLEPTAVAVKRIADDTKRIEKLRRRLSDISWWMRYFAQHIAVRANREDGCRGHFWDGRFKAELLLDVASVLRCMLYVDLNVIRAGVAASIQESDFTAAKDRLDDLRVALATLDDGQLRLSLEPGGDAFHWERLDHPCSGWLSPIEMDARPLGMLQAEAARDSLPELAATDSTQTIQQTLTSTALAPKSKTCDQTAKENTTEEASEEPVPGEPATGEPATGESVPEEPVSGEPVSGEPVSGEPDASRRFARRVSNKGALPLTLPKYLMLLDMIGRIPRVGGSGVISEHVEPLIADLGIKLPYSIESVLVFDKRYDISPGVSINPRNEDAKAATPVIMPAPNVSES